MFVVVESYISISWLIYLDGCGIIDVLSYYSMITMVCYNPSKFELRFESGDVMLSCISVIRLTLWNLFDVM